MAQARTLKAFNAACYAASLPESGPDRAPRPISRAALTGKLGCARQTIRGYEKAAGVQTVKNHALIAERPDRAFDPALVVERPESMFIMRRGAGFVLCQTLPNSYVAPKFERAGLGRMRHHRENRARFTDAGSDSHTCKRYYTDAVKAIKRRNKSETAYLCNGPYQGRKDVFEWVPL
jgi:hypothetical protein